MKLYLQTADGGAVKNIELSFPDAGVSLRAGYGAVDGQLTMITAGEFTLPTMTFPELDVELDFSRPARTGKGKARADSAARPAFDDGFLDGLRGHCNIELVVEVKIPVLGIRKGTHHFRVGIVDGAINFKQLESGLASLEDSILDFEVKDQRLVLVRDVPLLPIETKDLVYWELDQKNQTLARENRVTLRTLLHPVVPKIGEESEEIRSERKRKQPLQRVKAEEIDIALALGAGRVALPGGGEIQLGLDGKDAFSRLSVRGEIEYRPDGETAATEVTASGEDISLALAELPTGRGPLSVELRARELAHLSLSMTGLTPGRLTARFRDVALVGFRFGSPDRA